MELLKEYNTGNLKRCEKTADGLFCLGKASVKEIYKTGDGKTEIIIREDGAYAKIIGAFGISAWYRIPVVGLKRPVRAVLMDLDGTTVKSESFWIQMLRLTCSRILGDPRFDFSDEDIPNLSGNSVTEHLDYCLKKYSPETDIHHALDIHYRTSLEELEKIERGAERYQSAFVPNEGLKDFLLLLKSKGIRIGLVTSGIYIKAYREIEAAFKTIGLGKPEEFYDAVITGGTPVKKGSVGTLGELPLKPHPWLYAEVCHTGLNLSYDERDYIVGIEDSGPGVCSVRLAGFNAFGLSDGNIVSNGYDFFCNDIRNKLTDFIELIL